MLFYHKHGLMSSSSINGTILFTMASAAGQLEQSSEENNSTTAKDLSESDLPGWALPNCSPTCAIQSTAGYNGVML